MLEVIKEIPLGIYKSESGGGGEVNNQNKTITENGVYTADAGYTGLGTVTVDVPSSQTKDYYANFRVHGDFPIDVNTGEVYFNGAYNGDKCFLELPELFNPEGNWEFALKIKTNGGFNRVQRIIGSKTYPLGAIKLILENSIFYLYLTSTNTDWDIADEIAGTHTFSEYETYYIKLKFDGTKYTLDFSTDGVNYINDITVNSSVKVKSVENIRLGAQPVLGNLSSFNGFMDLSQTYIKTGDTIWWSPVVNAERVYNGVSIIGSNAETYINYATGEMGNFSSDGKGKVQAAFMQDYSWEETLSFDIGVHFKVGDTFNPDGRIFNYDGGADSTYGPFTGGKSLTFYNGSYMDFYALPENPLPNTEYWLRWKYDWVKNTVSSYYSTDGVNFTLNEEKAPSFTPVFGYATIAVGGRTQDASPCVFNGTIFLDDCYIYVNSRKVW